MAIQDLSNSSQEGVDFEKAVVSEHDTAPRDDDPLFGVQETKRLLRKLDIRLVPFLALLYL
jgi:hypothetical protein